MAEKTTILVVDDSLVNLAVLDEILERENYSVLLANNGERALSTAKKEQPALILLDVVMAGWDGFETCERIKSDPELAHIPILFLSGLGDTQNKVRALQVGGVDYVSKPFQEEELLARVRTHVELSRLRENLEDEVARQTEQIRSLMEALQLSYQKAQESSMLKTQFLHNISHEFRTPMNIILGMTEELIEDTELDEEQHEMADAVLNAGRQLFEILTNMLNFSQQFEGELKQEEVVFNLAELVSTVAESFAGEAAKQQVKLTIALNPEIPAKLRGRGESLRDVFNKLLSNAIKYNKPKGEVEISAEVAQDFGDKLNLRCVVRDTGVGIPEDKRKHLFEAFSQVDGSSTREYGGVGMGLALAKMYLESMGGEIGLENQGEQGSSFWFQVTLDKVEEESMRRA
jgi:signal transduction histidine kinase